MVLTELSLSALLYVLLYFNLWKDCYTLIYEKIVIF